MLTNPAHEPANLWVVTDLDGTLLDHHYDWSAAKATLTWLKQIGISVIPCTSKTAEEVRRFRRDAELDGPFIVETVAPSWVALTPKPGNRAWGAPMPSCGIS